MASMNNKSVPTIKGDRIGPWKLGETLGLGSTGKVQLAYNESTNQQSAIKVISKSIFSAKVNGNGSIAAASTPDSLPYGIEREIIIMKLLNHSNVLRLYDVWETNSNLYMVLEYAQKGELFNLLVERGPLPENEAVRFFRQIIIGISYCHALGIVHRDLKPENLLLDHKFNIKIADFGMAALETEDKLLETSCGSPHYAAPEIVSGIPYHGFASDVWSCGVILYALLTGRLPFDEEDGNIRNLLLKVQTGKYEMPDDDEISKDAMDLIERILTVDPEKRIKTRDILKHPLLQKYPSINDSKSIRNLPREDTYLHPLSEGASSDIDQTILQNLVVLWHGRDPNNISAKLREPGANAEKTLYALLDRFKNDTEKEALRQKQIKRRQSQSQSQSVPVSAPVSAPVPSSMIKTLVKSNIAVSPKKRTRTSVISVSSSHKRPVSFNKISSMANHSSGSSSHSTTPSKKAAINFSSNKRLSGIISHSNSSSPTPASRNKRVSIIDLEKSSDAPPVPMSVLNDYNHNSKNKRMSRTNMRLSFKPSTKRGSITTKLISTYAKLSEDDDWEYIEKETKRTSSDFATLCDEIFEHEKFEQIRKEKEELERKVKEQKELEERERREREAETIRRLQEREGLKKRQLEMQQQMDEEVANLRNELQSQQLSGVEESVELEASNGRSVSAPLERKKRDSVANIESSIDDILRQRTFSLQTRPVSKLDPGIFGAENGATETDYSSPPEEKRLQNERIILETIRRSKFLGSSFDLKKELDAAEKEKSRKHSQQYSKSERVASTTNDPYETQVLPKNATNIDSLNDSSISREPRKLSEVKVPQFTRKSRYFSESNKRMSVLSLYSTTQSFKNLSDMLKERDGNVENTRESPTPNSAHEPEFLFETVNEDAECTGDSSNDGRLYELREDSDLIKGGMKLSFSDRFKESEKDPQVVEDVNVKLPTLPPLDSKNASGLGIYQSSTESIVEPHPQNVKSMIPPENKEETKQSAPSEQAQKLVEHGASKEENLNDVIQKRRVQDNEKSRKPLGDITEKKSNMSFFRKFSKSSSHSKADTDFDAELYAKVNSKQLFNGLQNLLRGWTKYGLKDVKCFPEKLMLTGKLSSENILSLRSTLFEMVVWQRGNASIVGFRKKTGSTKTLKRLVNEVEKVLVKEGVLK